MLPLTLNGKAFYPVYSRLFSTAYQLWEIYPLSSIRLTYLKVVHFYEEILHIYVYTHTHTHTRTHTEIQIKDLFVYNIHVKSTNTFTSHFVPRIPLKLDAIENSLYFKDAKCMRILFSQSSQGLRKNQCPQTPGQLEIHVGRYTTRPWSSDHCSEKAGAFQRPRLPVQFTPPEDNLWVKFAWDHFLPAPPHPAPSWKSGNILAAVHLMFWFLFTVMPPFLGLRHCRNNSSLAKMILIWWKS